MNEAGEHIFLRLERDLLKALVHAQNNKTKNFVEDVCAAFLKTDGIIAAAFFQTDQIGLKKFLFYSAGKIDFVARIKDPEKFHSIFQNVDEPTFLNFNGNLREVFDYSELSPNTKIILWPMAVNGEKFAWAFLTNFSDEVIKIFLNIFKTMETEFKSILEKINFSLSEQRAVQDKAFFPQIEKYFPDILILQDLNGTICEINKVGVLILGYPLKEIIGKPIISVLADKTILETDFNLQPRQGRQQKAKFYETEILEANGKRSPVKVYAFPVNDPQQQLLLIVREIKDDEVTTSQEKGDQQSYQIPLNPIDDAVIGTDEKGIIRFFNRSAVLLLKTKPEKIIGRFIQELIKQKNVHANGPQKNPFTHVLETGEPLNLNANLYVVDAENTEHIVAANISSILRTDGTVNGLVIVLKEAFRDYLELALKERERQLFTLMDNLPGMAYRCLADENHTMKFVSKSVRALTGYNPDELIDNKQISYMQLIVPEDREKIRNHITSLSNKKKSFTAIYRIQNKKGGIRWVREQGRMVSDETKSKFIEGYITDITEKEMASRKAQKLNQILDTIRNISQLIVRETDVDVLLQKTSVLLTRNSKIGFSFIIKSASDGEIKNIYFPDGQISGIKDTKLEKWVKKIARTKSKLFNVNPENAWNDEIASKLEGNKGPFVAIPLGHKRRFIGLICITGSINNLNADEKGLLIDLASDLAFAINALELEKEHTKIERTIQLIINEIKGKNSQEVLKSLIENIAYYLKADQVFAGQLVTQNGKDIIRTIAVFKNGKHVENFDFPITGTPCARVLKQGLVTIPDHVAEKFPAKHPLKVEGFRGCVGTSLQDFSEGNIGILVALTKEKIEHVGLTETIFQMFAHRTVLELKRLGSEQALQESEYRYRMLFKNSPFGIYRTSPEGKILIANTVFISMLGYDSLNELKQKNIEKDIYSDAYQRKQFIRKLLQSDDFVVYETAWKRKDGSLIYVRQKTKAIRDAEGNVLFFDGTVEDITERKEKEEFIKYQNKLLENAQDAIIGTDGNYRIRYWNKSAEKLYGWKMEEVIGKKIDEIVKIDIPWKIRMEIRKIARTKGSWRGEVIQFNRKGEKLYIDMAVTDLYDESGKLIASVGINRDITEKVRYEEALKSSEESYRGLLDSVMEAIYVQAPDGAFLDVNQGAVKIYGYPKEYLIGKTPADVSAPGKNDMQKIMEKFKKALQGEPQQFEFWGRRANGEIFPKNVRLYKGKYFGQDVVIALAEDITEKKKVQEKLIELTEAIEQSPVSVIITDIEGNIEYVNPTFSQTSGYASEEVLGKNPRILKSGKVPDKVYQDLWQTISSGKIWHGEFINKRKDGSFFWEEATIGPIFDPDGVIKHYLAIKEDITERKKLEEEKAALEKQLHQNQRLETIGTLAGGIAHDFNNILTPILGYAEMIKMAVKNDLKLTMKADQIIKASLRARDLIQQILTFSRQIDQKAKPVYLQYIVNEATHLIRASIPSTIKLKKEIDKSCPPVLADPAKLHQVIMNLCTNAYQAMEKNGGELRIRLEHLQVDETTARFHPNLKAGAYVHLSVADTGIGMEPWVKDRIFEPFFTTKGVGKGTGLGLSVVHGIIKNYKGEITVESEKNKGTAFHVYLPVADVERIKEKKKQDVIPRGNEYILLVDDEPSVLDLEQQMLEYFGYHTLGLSDSTKVLDELNKHPGKYQMLITDLTMPNLTGRQLAELVRIRFPNLPIVMITGYSEELTPDMKKKYGIQAILMKPVVAHEFAKTVRRILDAQIDKM